MEAARDRVLVVPTVTGIGIGLREVEGEEVEEAAVCIYVEEGVEAPEGLPEVLGGVPVRIIPLSVEPCALPDERPYGEMKGGIRIAHPRAGAGTFGAVVKDTEVEEEKEPTYYGLTAQHVVGDTAGESWPNVVFQPLAPLPIDPEPDEFRASAVGSVVAVERPEPVPFVGGAIVGDVDAALFELDLAAANERFRSPAIVDMSGEGEMVPAVTATAQPQLCGLVRKRGFVTGYTEGMVKGIHCHFAWSPGGTNTYLVEQFLIETVSSNPHPELLFGKEGDSGALVLDKESPTALGLLWGKDLGGLRAMASKIWKIEEAFGVTAVL
jgi:hypothetical protein